MLCFMPIGNWQQLCRLQRKTHWDIYVPVRLLLCLVVKGQPTSQTAHAGTECARGISPHFSGITIRCSSVFCLFVDTNKRERVWVTTFAESEGKRISDDCSVRCILRPTLTNNGSISWPNTHATEQQKHLKY